MLTRYSDSKQDCGSKLAPLNRGSRYKECLRKTTTPVVVIVVYSLLFNLTRNSGALMTTTTTTTLTCRTTTQGVVGSNCNG